MASRKTVRRLALSAALAAAALTLFAAPAGASVFGPRAGHSPNANDIRTAYWVAIVVGALLIVVVHAFLIMALVRFRARRGRSPRRFTAGARAFLRPAAPLVAVAVGLFVFGIVMTTKTREVQATGPEGLNADSDLLAQVNGLSIPADAHPLVLPSMRTNCDIWPAFMSHSTTAPLGAYCHRMSSLPSLLKSPKPATRQPAALPACSRSCATPPSAAISETRT